MTMSFDRDTQIVGATHRGDAAVRWLQDRYDRRDRDKAKPFTKLRLEREPDNKYDANAIRVVSVMGIWLGYVPRDVAAYYARFLDCGYDVRAFKTRDTWASMRIVAPGTMAMPKKQFNDGEGNEYHPLHNAGRNVPSVSDELSIL